MSTEIKNTQYYPALDGLRGLAILLVVAYHNFGFINLTFFGWLGVDLFFVLSGFLISDILLNSLGKKNFLKNFYTRRILRIFPLYYLSLLLFLYILPFICKNVPIDYFSDNQFYLWTYLQNWLYSFKPTNETVLHHFWSLAVEEQFYLLWPFAILIIKNKNILLTIVLFTLIFINILRIVFWTLEIENLAYLTLYTFTRIDGLCIGSAVALLLRINKNFLSNYTALIIAGLAILNLAFYFLNDEKKFPYLAFIGYTTFAIVFGILVYEAVIGKTNLINKILGNGVLKLLGKVSYGFYIFHWPLYLYLAPYLNSFFERNGFSPDNIVHMLSSVCATVAAFLVSLISYKYYESYFLKLKEKFN